MTFPYRRWPIEAGPLAPAGDACRPVIHVRVRGRTGDAIVQGLVDTGADATILPTQLAETLGIEVERASTTKVAGLVGPGAPLASGFAGFQLGEGESALRWSSRVGFMPFGPDDEAVILGHAGFLEYFVATFDGRARVLELTPADDFPATP